MRDLFTFGDDTQQTTHDFPRTRLGQIFTKANVFRLGNRADFLGDPVTQLPGNLHGIIALGHAAFQHDKRHNGLAGGVVGTPDHSRLGHQRVGHQRRLDFHGAQTVSRYVQHIVNTPHDPEVAIGVALRTITGQIIAFELFREIAFLEAFWVTPDVADHGGPGPLDDEETTHAVFNIAPGFIHNGSGNTRQRHGA